MIGFTSAGGDTLKPITYTGSASLQTGSSITLQMPVGKYNMASVTLTVSGGAGGAMTAKTDNNITLSSSTATSIAGATAITLHGYNASGWTTVTYSVTLSKQ